MTPRPPLNWVVQRLKDAAQINPDVLPETTPETRPMAYIDIGNVTSDGMILKPELLVFGASPSRARRTVKRGDTIISTVRTYLKAVAYLQDPSPDLVVSTGFAVLRPKAHIHPAYLAWLVRSEPFIQSVIAHSTGIGYPAIAPGDLGRLPTWAPDMNTQRAIAEYLDRETTDIDRLVGRKQQLRALLVERGKSLVHQAVTKGLGHQPMMDSGHEWIGEIPKGWMVAPLRRVARLESGHTPSRGVPEYWIDCTVPWVSLADIQQIRTHGRDTLYDTHEKVSELGLANSAARLLPAGTVMLSRTASVGFSAVMGVPMATTQDFANWVCGPELLPRYLLHVLRAMRQELGRLTMGSTHQTIYMPIIWSLVVPLPALDEQRQVVEHIDFETHRLRELDAHIGQQLRLLRERRVALITAAVTGQLEIGRGTSSDA